ncbi:hypothetical protein ZHAS_00019308 [Anopheles sinensis]|uniref:Protein kinase domain-containing protein n=1 Tax=Anopheles sinensis TaxID=74873 RepID=A0A084WM18_ANOSI|nr:hypothetical protein ZHAS_00019308 [Anopheles sinensis]
MMIQIGLHMNIVYFLGAVTKDRARGKIMLIFEYCQYGSLDVFLRDNAQRFVGCLDQLQNYEVCNAQLEMTHVDQEDKTDIGEWQLKTTDLISWASQVANGMDYLSSRNILHGDLAARNVLLYSLKVAKISDFGLSRKLERGIYKKSTDSPLPYKWLALECFTDGSFSVKTDVWAFGVFLWELFSLGATPYPGVTDGKQLLTMLQNAYRLENPAHSNQELYDLMLSCWYVVPHRRPDFRELASVFNAMLPVELRNIYIALQSQYIQQAILRHASAPTVEESTV